MGDPALPASAVSFDKVDSLIRRKLTIRLLLFALFLAIIIGFQWRAGAYSSEFSAHNDEPGHFVTGLMVRDYIAAGLPESPLPYARSYYEHYPKVAIGHWPPFFYLLQAAFMLVLPPGRVAVLLLMACLSALVAVTVAEVLRPETGILAGVGGGLYLISFPAWRMDSSSVMAEVLMSLLVLWALLAFAQYLDRPEWPSAALFGILASLALMTKGTGILLAPVPLLAVLMTRRFHLLRRPWFWLPAVLVLGICAPWYSLAPGALHEKVLPYGGLSVNEYTISPSFRYVVTTMGVFPVALVAAGLLDTVLKPLFRRGPDARWAVLATVFPSMILFRILVRAWTLRHMVYALPVAVLFAVVALHRFVPNLPWIGRTRPKAVVAAALALLCAIQLRDFPRKPGTGMREVAKTIVGIPGIDKAGVLLVSDGKGEGMLVSEIALLDRRPGIFLLRGSKIIAPTNFMGYLENTNLISSAELEKKLESMPVSLIVIDMMPLDNPFDRMALFRTLNAYPERWERIADLPRYDPSWDTPGRVVIYRPAGQAPRPLLHIPDQLADMAGELGP